jgi:2-polyprenyl-3-methyl-5-hydroxy-6-metoxy-1,4-benzoquinol methylase
MNGVEFPTSIEGERLDSTHHPSQPEDAHVKERVQAFWDDTPCGTRELEEQRGTPEFFARLALERDEREPFIPDFARFKDQAGLSVLEVGVGAGSDSIRFARAGARFTGVDLTEAAISLTSRRHRREYRE